LTSTSAKTENLAPAIKEAGMSWNVRGRYVETCSCELMCPCNLSFDHGATYDFGRVTLVFDIQEGGVDGRAGRQARRRLQRTARWPDGGTRTCGRGARRRAGPFEVEHDGVLHRIRIGDAIDFEIRDIVPFGVETGHPIRFNGMFHPVGSNLTMAEATRSRISPFGIEYEGKTGPSTAEFSGPPDPRPVNMEPFLAGSGRWPR
jgi:hypothetical protein